ncbi:MAG: aminoacyl-tRNA hydrolase [Planctomycetota bacterium]|jgi:PTH1 family peptidyl-tRNA hydrolase
MAEIKMVVGLGNPGAKYAGTRHNTGFDVVDGLARKLGTDIKKKKFGGLFCQCSLDNKTLILLKPQQYMNCSGQVVATARGFYRLGLEDIIVVTDDMALEPGRIRIRTKGSSGGHNGLQDIIARVGSGDFARVRVGVGQSAGRDAADYVLSRPGEEERQLTGRAVETAQQAIMCWARDGAEAAMNKFNN